MRTKEAFVISQNNSLARSFVLYIKTYTQPTPTVSRNSTEPVNAKLHTEQNSQGAPGVDMLLQVVVILKKIPSVQFKYSYHISLHFGLRFILLEKQLQRRLEMADTTLLIQQRACML